MKIRPKDLLDYEGEVMTLRSDTRCHKDTLDTSEYKYIWIRHETDTSLVYVKARELRNAMHEGYIHPDLLKNGQYVGTTLKAFYKGTPYKGKTCEVFIFDLSRPESERHGEIPQHTFAHQRKILAYRYKGDMKQIDAAMERWKTRYLAKNASANSLMPKTQTPEQKKIAQLEERLARLQGRISGRQPTLKKKPTQTLPELDAYIKEYASHIRKVITKRIVENGIPRLETKEYDPATKDLATVGKYEDTTDIKGKRTALLALQVAALKLTVPNYKEDVRVSHKQTVRIHTNTAHSPVYCVVLKMRKEKEEIDD